RRGHIVRDLVDRPQLERALQVDAATAHANHVLNTSCLLERHGEGAADQAHAEHGQSAKTVIFHVCGPMSQACSAARSACRKRSFSAGRPIVTRRCSGSPYMPIGRTITPCSSKR